MADCFNVTSVNGGAIALGHPLGATGVRQGESVHRDHDDSSLPLIVLFTKLQRAWRNSRVEINKSSAHQW